MEPKRLFFSLSKAFIDKLVGLTEKWSRLQTDLRGITRSWNVPNLPLAENPRGDPT